MLALAPGMNPTLFGGSGSVCMKLRSAVKAGEPCEDAGKRTGRGIPGLPRAHADAAAGVPEIEDNQRWRRLRVGAG